VIIHAGCSLELPAKSVKLSSLNVNINGRKTNPAIIAKDESNSFTVTEEEHLAILKTQDKYVISEEELYDIVNSVISVTAKNDSGLRMTGKNKMTVMTYEQKPVDLFEFTFCTEAGSEQFVLASADLRVGTILAVAEGSLKNTGEEFVEFLYEGLENYINAAILKYNSITEDKVQAILDKLAGEQTDISLNVSLTGNNAGEWVLDKLDSDFIIQKQPMLMTQWGQGTLGPNEPDGYVYNNYIKDFYKNDQFLAGCGPVAIAQIVAYHGYISQTAPHKPQNFSAKDWGNWNGRYNLEQIRSVSKWENKDSVMININLNPRITISIPSFPSLDTVKGQLNALMYQTGKLSRAKYKEGYTKITMANARAAFIQLGYDIYYYNTNATTLTGTLEDFKASYGTSPVIIRNALNGDMPIMMRGGTAVKLADGKNGGHFWVVDGYGSMTYLYQYFRHTDAKQIIYSTLTLNNSLMVHCNMGWDGDSDGWYVYGIFDATYDLLNPNSPYNPVFDRASEWNFSNRTNVLIPRKP
jgi:hypothetical protein